MWTILSVFFAMLIGIALWAALIWLIKKLFKLAFIVIGWIAALLWHIITWPFVALKRFLFG